MNQSIKHLFVFLMCTGMLYASKEWIVGSAADVSPKTTGGTVLMGGGSDVDAAIKWMITRSGGGDFVVIRTSGSDGYNSYIFSDLGGVNSVETILFESKADASNTELVNKIRNAEALFIAGGDQAMYVNYWKDTPVEDAINYLIKTKKVPVGGTSAGCAILTNVYYGALNGSSTSADALTNPYAASNGISRDDFIDAPFLDNTISDTHYLARGRQGRHMSWLARMNKDWAIADPRGIGVDEATAVCIDTAGKAMVFGSSAALFFRPYCGAPEKCVTGSPLNWTKGVKVYRVLGNATGTGWVNLADWTQCSGGSWEYWTVNNGSYATTPTAPSGCTQTSVDMPNRNKLSTIQTVNSQSLYQYTISGKRVLLNKSHERKLAIVKHGVYEILLGE